MTPNITDLQDESRFTKLIEMEISNMMPFLKENLRKSSAVTTSYNILAMLLLPAVTGVTTYQAVKLGFGTAVSSVGWALIGSLVVLIPLHEFIHGMTFKFFGASDVRYMVVLRQFMFFAGAHNFVIGKREFAVVAVMPFLVINTVLCIFALTITEVRVIAFIALLLHTLCCSGDMAILNYLWLHRDRKLYTYDDMDTRMTYFYAQSGEVI